MPQELKAALVAIAGIVLLLLYTTVAFRVVVPSIIEARFDGSALVALLAGFGLLMAGALFCYAWVGAVCRILTRQPERPEEGDPTDAEH